MYRKVETNVFHARVQHGIPAPYRIDTQLLQSSHTVGGRERIRTESHKPCQDVRVQIHFRSRKMGKNSPAQVLNIYTENQAYANIFKLDLG